MTLPLANRTILLVEDDSAVRGLMRIVLEQAGAAVVEARHGAEAMGLLDAANDFSVVVTDLSMPIMDGAALVRAAAHRHPAISWVICSALTDQLPADVHETVDAVVQKPFVPSRFVRAVAEASVVCTV